MEIRDNSLKFYYKLLKPFFVSRFTKPYCFSKINSTVSISIRNEFKFNCFLGHQLDEVFCIIQVSLSNFILSAHSELPLHIPYSLYWNVKLSVLLRAFFFFENVFISILLKNPFFNFKINKKCLQLYF